MDEEEEKSHGTIAWEKFKESRVFKTYQSDGIDKEAAMLLAFMEGRCSVHLGDKYE